jgi:uncharacterized protein (TIGR04255 family)
MGVTYKNPPINELVIGVYFDRDVLSLRPDHVGVFWNRHRRDFPTIRPQPPLTRPTVNIWDTNFPIVDPLSMPRYWLESADGVTLLQLQRNAFLVNWRRRNKDYPHFKAVKDYFDAYLGNFFSFLEEELHETGRRVRLAELTYINSIEPCEYWASLLDTPKVLPRFSLPIVVVDALGPSDFHQVTIDRMAPDTTLQTTVRSARSLGDPTKPILIFELSAVRLIPENESQNGWFPRAHVLIGRCFTEMTNPDIRTTYWLPE